MLDRRLQKKVTANCLSIAGFDGSGGAGIQADLKTFSAFGCYGMTVLTALPVQNTCGVRACYDIPLISIEEQLQAIFDDITPDSIKLGMLFSSSIIELVADFLEENARAIPIVLDPVMIAKSGHALLQPEAIHALKTRLIPLATLITPNLPEAHALVEVDGDTEFMAAALLDLGPEAVLLKGGHSEGDDSNDLLLERGGQPLWLEASRIPSNNTHGTGCTLSAAICSCLGLGYSLTESCHLAKRYLSAAIQAAKDQTIGKGHGPVQHFYHLWPAIDKI
jgi:hydroxymethylpyrimidine/phosphomethylpyrimidine kinase